MSGVIRREQVHTVPRPSTSQAMERKKTTSRELKEYFNGYDMFVSLSVRILPVRKLLNMSLWYKTVTMGLRWFGGAATLK